MSDSILSKIRDGNLDELNEYYNEHLNSYTNLYQQYLEKMSGNDDDVMQAEEELKPQIIEKNNLLLSLADIFLKNNQKSAELIENDYQMIENKTKQLQDLKSSYDNLEETETQNNKGEEIKAQKKIENIMSYSQNYKYISTGLNVTANVLICFLAIGIARIVILEKNL